MPDNTIETLLRLRLDEASARKNETEISKLTEMLTKLGRTRAIDDLAKKFAGMSQEAGGSEKAIKSLNAELSKIGATEKEIDDAAKAFERYSKAAEKAAEKTGAQGRFDDVSQKVSLAGDVGSNAATVGGLARSVGLGGVGDVVSGGGELIELAEALPRLKESLSGLPGAAKSAVSAIGIGNLGMVGAIAAAAALITKIQADVAAATEKASGTISTFQDVAEIAATGTTESIKALIAEQENTLSGLEARKSKADTILSGLNEGIQQNLNPAQQALLEFNTAIGTGGAELKAARDAADEANKSYEEGRLRLETLKNALDDASVAANDAAEAEKKLAAERTQDILDAAAAAGQEESARRRAMNASVEQNESRLRAIEDERAAIEAQLSVLESSGDTSEQVASQIEQLKSELGSLGKEAEFITGTALEAAKAREAEKKAIEDQRKAEEQAIRAAEQAAQKRLDIERKYSDAVVGAAKAASDKAADALKKLQDRQTDLQISFQQDLNKLAIDQRDRELEDAIKAQQGEADAYEAHYLSLKKIRDNAIDSEQDALKNRDFLAAAQIREQANREMDAEGDAFEQQQKEAERQQERARSEQLRELDRQRRDRLQALQDQRVEAKLAYNRELRDANDARQRSLRDAADARRAELKLAQDSATAILSVKKQQAEGEFQLAQNLFKTLGSVGGATSGGASSGGGFNTGLPAGNFISSGGLRSGSSSVTVGGNKSVTFNINGANNPAAIQREVASYAQRIGLV